MKKKLSKIRSNVLFYGPSSLAMLLFSINFYFDRENLFMIICLFLCVLCAFQTFRYYKKSLEFK